VRKFPQHINEGMERREQRKKELQTSLNLHFVF